MRVSLQIVDISFYVIFQLTITNAAKRDSREIRERNHEPNVENKRVNRVVRSNLYEYRDTFER